ncbi:MAG: tRNA (adenosine(37)-N6)-threonylcarbamoyltransferase complex transferase subunit TsaD [Proteobacteria bacterium]|nr:tRNA (adenosine(37)-N6)-threonylcarbamoyltransferase complex transferase subunit TsaD [Pseudomonadota bacterium]
MLVLGIESSCDDTAAAVLENNRILSSVLNCQDLVHAKFGGVVPELASRRHLQSIHPIVVEALSKAGVQLSGINLIAATQGPGLIGSLLVGFSYAKALAHVRRIPFVGVDHMAGHILSVFLGTEKPSFPYIALIVSGGTSSIFLAKDFHQFELLGRTRDDAAGEAFDKVAKMLGLPYPGGPHVSATAAFGDPRYVRFPRAWLEEQSFDFSFSGLKTAVLNHVNQQKIKNAELQLHEICASFQESVVDVLVEKSIFAAKAHNIHTLVIGGGVSANNRLREVFTRRCQEEGFTFHAPLPQYCTDNAAMIALAGYHKFNKHGAHEMGEDVYSRSQLG